MSTATSTLDLSKSTRVPFARLTRVELRKSYDTRAGFWLLLGTALLVVLAMLIALLVTLNSDSGSLTTFLKTTNYTSQILLPVVGILLVTGEYGQRTGMVTFVLEPHRGRVVWSKLVAGLLLALVVAVIAFVVALVLNAVVGGSTGDLSVLSVGGFLLSQCIAMLIGFAFAALLLNTAASIVAYFAYYFVVPIALGALAFFVDWFRDVYPWIDFNVATRSLVEADLSGKDWAHFAVAGLIWLVVPLVLGLRRILRAEVK